MQINLNGKSHETPEGTTIAGLIEQLNLADQACAVEVNKALVTKVNHATHTLSEGDTVELVTLVGGG
ncbi:MAG: sulfur carrier protein ThiS [Phycisphaera sp.]|nr:MAG: sulfur carrier protein ThiS [Phycisphaera sp.]